MAHGQAVTRWVCRTERNYLEKEMELGSDPGNPSRFAFTMQRSGSAPKSRILELAHNTEYRSIRRFEKPDSVSGKIVPSPFRKQKHTN